MENKPEQDNPIDDLVIYNDEQRWWANIKDNCEATIQQFEDSMKLQKEILLMSESKIKELADKDIETIMRDKGLACEDCGSLGHNSGEC